MATAAPALVFAGRAISVLRALTKVAPVHASVMAPAVVAHATATRHGGAASASCSLGKWSRGLQPHPHRLTCQQTGRSVCDLLRSCVADGAGAKMPKCSRKRTGLQTLRRRLLCLTHDLPQNSCCSGRRQCELPRTGMQLRPRQAWSRVAQLATPRCRWQRHPVSLLQQPAALRWRTVILSSSARSGQPLSLPAPLQMRSTSRQFGRTDVMRRRASPERSGRPRITRPHFRARGSARAWERSTQTPCSSR